MSTSEIINIILIPFCFMIPDKPLHYIRQSGGISWPFSNLSSGSLGLSCSGIVDKQFLEQFYKIKYFINAINIYANDMQRT